MKAGTIILTSLFAAVLASCSKTSKADTRKEQEAGFERTFGFDPRASITSINYTSHYTRELTDGTTAVWLGFTYDQITFQKIVGGGYSTSTSTTVPDIKPSPAWWRKPPANVTIYSRTQEDTPADEGFSFEEYLWHDESAGMVFLYKSYSG
ncbi:hypothetical protein [Luteolibacter soli]|uniref:Lipoprotein n=1 Tax=Luteolibacter soli TaxID=3135280 RepID=A0ABU9AYV4_9BACT